MNYPNVNTFRVGSVERRVNNALSQVAVAMSEAEDVRLMQMALAADYVLMSQEDARWLMILALAGCTLSEACSIIAA